MCFDLDSAPPIRPVAGAEVDRESLTLRAADGNAFRACHARPAETTGVATIILPDIRGLHHYYEELAVQFAEIGVEALAIDYFGRTAGTGDRGDDFDHGPHVAETTWAGLSADIASAATYLRGSTGHEVRSLFVTGFCMGGRNAFLASTLGLGLSGVIGFYGSLGPAAPSKTPSPLESATGFECPVLGISGGTDTGIPIASVQQFRDVLATTGLDHEIVVEPDAPHSFFDRKQAEFQTQSDDAWARVRRFIEVHGAN